MRIRCYIEPSHGGAIRTIKIPLANGTQHLTVVGADQLSLGLDEPS